MPNPLENHFLCTPHGGFSLKAKSRFGKCFILSKYKFSMSNNNNKNTTTQQTQGKLKVETHQTYPKHNHLDHKDDDVPREFIRVLETQRRQLSHESKEKQQKSKI